MPFPDACHGRHDLTRRAVATLQCVIIDEGLLHRMKLSVWSRQAFDRGQRTSIRLDCQHQARYDPPAVQMHRAGAALAVIATFLCTSECQALAQEIEQ